MRTRSTIAKLNAIIMQKYESYRTRRLPITTFTEEPYTDANGTELQWRRTVCRLNGNGRTTLHRMQIAQYRLDALRDLMRLEMPDSFGDVEDAPITTTIIGGSTIIPRPAANQAYKTALDAAKSRNSTAYAQHKSAAGDVPVSDRQQRAATIPT